MKKKISIAILTLLLIGQIPLLYGQTTINMQKEGGVYVVPCTVNGIKLRFIFDTGASDVSISLTEALFMLKNGYLKPEDILGTKKFTDATGNISDGTKIILRKVEFSGLILTNVEASVVHELSAPLLLGQTAMAQLGKFQFDPNNGVLTILNGTSYSNNNSSPQTTTNNNAQTTTNNNSQTTTYNNAQTTTYNNSQSTCKKAIGAPTISNENEFEYIGSLNDGLAYVKQNGLYGFINANGIIVIPIIYAQALSFQNGVAEVMTKINGSYIISFIDKNGNKSNRTYSSN